MRQLKSMKKAFSVLLILLMVFATACGQTANEAVNSSSSADSSALVSQTGANTTGPSNEDGSKPVELLVSAAASLKDSLAEIKTLYEGKNTNVKLTFTFGSSGALQQQIENGAQVDVFVSAATKQMDALKDKGLLLDETRREFLQNDVVLIVPKDSAAVTDFKDLTSDKVKHIGLGEPKGVPVGQYAEEVLTKLGLLDKIKDKVVYGNDVKEVLTWVETGNADAGIVYSTDAKISDKVKVAASAPKDSHKAVLYPAAVIKDSKNAEAAKAFTEFLYSKEAKPVFEKYGFIFIDK
ncbi:molybdate-binding periplasmic protein precursor [Ruminiclostridium hungatei]|uniref:Molybdate-binding periplasmic protein n=1 Tax=Ruminiclostridium hungatei TaxID=48256 RepID=A0A1V4SFZ2_RUMHU|nr:molybdate ABC transporter substrate-binding protein [Ruminiclostridium hungatei]OPX42395.1 molybdate-binding periplasmic protein precursor [Ruminiclostridium hungatei]